MPTIYGNADQFIYDLQVTDPGVQWVREQLDAESIAYLANLPFEHRITPPGGVSPADDLLIVHASHPQMSDAVLTVEPDPFGLLPVTPRPEAERLIGTAQAELILTGHVHYASSGTVGNQRFASVGSVGSPYDADVRAAYGRAFWNGYNWQVQHCRASPPQGQVRGKAASAAFERRPFFGLCVLGEQEKGHKQKNSWPRISTERLSSM